MKKFFVGCVDNSPTNFSGKFFLDVERPPEEFSENIDCPYLVGYMNIALLKQDILTKKYTNVLMHHGMQQITSHC